MVVSFGWLGFWEGLKRCGLDVMEKYGSVTFPRMGVGFEQKCTEIRTEQKIYPFEVRDMMKYSKVELRRTGQGNEKAIVSYGVSMRRKTGVEII